MVMDNKERAVIARMTEGDDGAFDEVYRSCSGKLYRMALFITGNRNDSEDVLQETFVKCYLHRAELKDPERFEAWIYQILVRTAWHLEKQKKRKKEISYEGILEEARENGTGQAGRLQEDTSRPDPLSEILKQETSRELAQEIRKLDIKYRTAILLYYYNGLSTREIAEVTGTFEGTVKSRLNKARKLLRERLERKGRKGSDGWKEAVL